jgi:hypothetical protein
MAGRAAKEKTKKIRGAKAKNKESWPCLAVPGRKTKIRSWPGRAREPGAYFFKF